MSDWEITYDEWIPEEQPLREALCTLGNGYFATRGAAEEAHDDEKVHYPGTYLAGGYNRAVSKVAGREIENEDLVNWPNWLPLSFRHAAEEWFLLDRVEVISFRQELNLRQGVFSRHLHVRDANSRETVLVSRRFVSMASPHVAALEWELTPLNWSGEIEIRTALEGRLKNNGVPRYRDLEGQHLEPLEAGQYSEDIVFLHVQAIQSNIRMAQAARTQVFSGAEAVEAGRRTHTERNAYVEQVLTVQAEQQCPLRVEKIITLYTSRDFAISEELLEAKKNIARQGSFSELLQAHARTWGQLWSRCDLEIASSNETQQILRLHIFHLLQTVSINTVDLDVGVPARGLHGEAYRGHIFWDELFIFPFLNLRLPELTRELLMYRYHRLPEARYLAKAAGFRGAMFPWQSGSNGREESQVVHLNPKSRNWLPDHTYLQRHISAAIAYNVWQYYESTEDREFLSFYGAELILEIALFWSTVATRREGSNQFEIRHVVGPDEYHTDYPDTDEPGVNNNAYTNVMAVWVIQRALNLTNVLEDMRKRELYEKLHITEEDIRRWEEIGSSMYVPFIGDSLIIGQFEGYDQLQEFNWEKYKAQHGASMRLDRILESEGDNVNKYKASKQADVIMLFYLFSANELMRLFKRLQYDLNREQIAANIEYYEARTSHGSTLSKIVHAWVMARSDRKRSWADFTDALRSDVSDVQGGTTQEGIHLGAMAGTLDIMQRGYLGLEIRDNVLWLNPMLPEEISQLQLQLRYRGHWLSLKLTHEKLTIRVDRGFAKEVQIGVQNEVYSFQTGDSREFNLKKEGAFKTG